MSELGNVGTRMPAASFKFNSFEEIKSHSSVLFNERLAIMFYLLDMHSIRMHASSDISEVLECKAILKQIYTNVRMLLRYNPTCRATLRLDTQDEGIYVPDVAISIIDRMIEHCEINGYTMKKLYIIVQEITRVQILIRDILQYFSYFIRPDFRQKPDVDVATENYKAMADFRTVEELRALVGRNAKIDFEGLGSSRIELNQTDEGDSDEENKDIIDYDANTDSKEEVPPIKESGETE
jgi:hypothetical protein